jgi:cephalosporin-C deacetylase
MSARPAEFESYWAEVDRELERYPAAPEMEPLPLRSTEFATVYGVRLTSTGPHRIFAYLSLPKGSGPAPGLIQTPRYGSVNHVPAYELRQRYAVLTLMHRGQRLADQPFAAAYPGLLTLNIDDPRRFIYRGIVADCLRGAEFLLSQRGVDTNRVGIVGDDLALITAARRPRLAVVHASELLLYRLLDACARTDAYPAEEVNDILRVFPGRRDAIMRTLALFDPAHHARELTARALLSAGDAGALGGPEWLQPLIDALDGSVELYRLSHEGRTDHDWLDRRLAELLGTAPVGVA